ncbi:MAG TPA: iron-sulfur cluster insertion protein ErpA [Phototrophicaceae bacterium]|jgi:iron-sulfur cluster assembly protein|nr:iron-sulfur cluster insertion protein ErpA [Phototrophicaceae bacterium]
MAVIELDQLQVGLEVPVLTVTPAAVNTIRNLMEQRQIPDHALRVFVSGGGCSGMQYGMAFEAKAQDYDNVVEVDGVRLLVDSTSLMYLQGATIDFVDSLMGGGFRIDNPNAVSSCGCGHSFKSKDSGDADSDGGSCGSCGSH